MSVFDVHNKEYPYYEMEQLKREMVFQKQWAENPDTMQNMVKVKKIHFFVGTLLKYDLHLKFKRAKKW